MALATIFSPLSTPARSGLLVRGIQSHIDILTRCDGWVLLWPTLRPRPRKRIYNSVNVRPAELPDQLTSWGRSEDIPKGSNTSL